MPGNLRAFTAEMIGTFALILIGAGSICMDVISGGHVGLTGIAFAHGLAIGVMVCALGPVSGGHFNPAVTAGFWVARRIDTVKAIGYVLAQLLGATLAALLLREVLHNFDFVNNAPFLGACDLSGIGAKGGAAVEAVGTFLLVTVIFGTAVLSEEKPLFAGLPIGLTITMVIFMAGPLTGAAVNPARAFGPAIASGHWAHHFVYWIGPLVGGMAAALLCENFLMPRTK